MVESPQAPPVVALRIGARLFELIVMCPLGSPGAAVPIAGSRAGELGVLNLAFAREPQAALRELRRLCELGRGDCGVLVEEDQLLEAVLASEGGRLQAVLLAGAAAQDDGAGGLSGRVARVGEAGARAIVVAASLREALAAQEAGADAVIAKGQEAGGWIGDSGAFVLCQQLVDALRIPVFAHGGIGLRTIAGACACGAAGAVLDSQLLLSRESPAPQELRVALAGADGSETVIVGAELRAGFQAHRRPGLDTLEQLRQAERELASEADGRERWRAAVTEAVARGEVLPLGQDVALAGELGRRFGTVAGIIDGLRAAIDAAAETLERENPLAEDSPLARSHRTRYPLVQGPMTRVSDRAEFAEAVAREGGAAVPGSRPDARRRGRRAAGEHRRTAGRALVGRGDPRLRAGRAASRAARRRARAPAPVRPDRGRAPRPGA